MQPVFASSNETWRPVEHLARVFGHSEVRKKQTLDFKNVLEDHQGTS